MLKIIIKKYLENMKEFDGLCGKYEGIWRNMRKIWRNTPYYKDTGIWKNSDLHFLSVLGDCWKSDARCWSSYTVKPLLTDTPVERTPPYSGQFSRSHRVLWGNNMATSVERIFSRADMKFLIAWWIIAKVYRIQQRWNDKRDVITYKFNT